MVGSPGPQEAPRRRNLKPDLIALPAESGEAVAEQPRNNNACVHGRNSTGTELPLLAHASNMDVAIGKGPVHVEDVEELSLQRGTFVSATFSRQ